LRPINAFAAKALPLALLQRSPYSPFLGRGKGIETVRGGKGNGRDRKGRRGKGKGNEIWGRFWQKNGEEK